MRIERLGPILYNLKMETKMAQLLQLSLKSTILLRESFLDILKLRKRDRERKERDVREWGFCIFYFAICTRLSLSGITN